MRAASSSVIGGPDEAQERVVRVYLEHDSGLVSHDPEGVRDAVREGDEAPELTAKACPPHRMASRPETR